MTFTNEEISNSIKDNNEILCLQKCSSSIENNHTVVSEKKY